MVSPVKHNDMLKTFFLLCVCCWWNTGYHNLAAQTTTGYDYTNYNIPATAALMTSLYVNENGQAFVPVNGGIFMPRDSAWFMPPAAGKYLTSFAPDLKDTALFVFANTKDSSELYYLKNSSRATIQRVVLSRLSKGIYHAIVKNKVCYIWGVDSVSSRIGILTKQKVRWLFQVKGMIRQVQVNDSAEIFFAMNQTIYKLNDRKIVLQLETPVSGFCFDASDSLLISYENNIARVAGNKIVVLATGVGGLLDYAAGKVFVLSNSRHQLCILNIKL
jgi:hypothetical protein